MDRQAPNPAARPFKDAAYQSLAYVTKSLSSPRRLELLDLLIQGPRTVEDLALAQSRPISNTSQHLQVLKHSRLVQTTRHGTSIEYRLAPGVAEVFAALRRLAHERSPTLQSTLNDYFASAHAEHSIAPDLLRDRLADGSAVLLDVRPPSEYRHAHLPGATSIPIGELRDRIGELPPDRLIVATCRGPYCTWAADAVAVLREHGYEAARFDQGVAEWSLDGGAVASAS